MNYGVYGEIDSNSLGSTFLVKSQFNVLWICFGAFAGY